MLHTPVCDLLGIEYPIVQAGMGPFTSAELVAAVSNAGGLGSLGAGARSTASLKEQLARTRELTNLPFAVNFTLSPSLPDPEGFQIALQAKPRVISFTMGDPGDYVKLAHDAGILVMHQAMTVEQADRAAERGVDIIIGQGSEAGGFGGRIAGLVIVPQVVDAVSPIPVLAAGGIADGRGLAAALVLGAQGVNIGTRFLASEEAPIDQGWKQAILSAEAGDAIKAEVWARIFPPRDPEYPVSPRVLRSPFVNQWESQPDASSREAERLREEIGNSIAEGRFGELFPFTGQTAGLIDDILPAGEIVRRLANQAEAALKRATQLANNPNP
jgi:nitronate monooxygenase/enoyl-[acyl-carrier protein] reductase II